MPTYRIGKLTDFPPGKGHVCTAGNATIAVFNVEGTLYAIDNTCPHVDGPLGEGGVSGKWVACPWHDWRFDVTTGRCQDPPEACVMTFPVTLEGEGVFVQVGPPSAGPGGGAGEAAPAPRLPDYDADHCWKCGRDLGPAREWVQVETEFGPVCKQCFHAADDLS